MKIFVLTFGGEETASTGYRWLQYAGLFRESGVEFAHAPVAGFSDFKSLAAHDLVVLQKTLVSGARLSAIRRHARRLVYDADDLIWLSPTREHRWLTRLRIEWRLRRIARSADACLAANEVIAADLRERGGRTTVVPMSLDGRRWGGADRPPSPVTVGWSGAPKNLFFLRSILPSLRRLQALHPEVRWLVHSGEDPGFDGFRYEHLPFVPGGEPTAVGRFHIGLLPLEDRPFARGKSPIKTLQYFASRVAVAGSAVGAAMEMLVDEETGLAVRTPADWEPVLERLIRDRALRDRLAERGRQAFESRYELQVVFRSLAGVIRSVASA
jgi:glycosyltransferase involved in cell wall biosynthesis